MRTVKEVSIELIEENEGSLAWRRSKECRWRQNDVAAVLKLQCLWLRERERERSIHRFWYCSDCDCHCVCDGGQRGWRGPSTVEMRGEWSNGGGFIKQTDTCSRGSCENCSRLVLLLYFFGVAVENGRKRSWWAFEPFGMGSGWAIWISFNLVLLCHFILFNHN